MSIISYAQNFEDVMLWRALGHVHNGRYIDLGAQDPLVDSVSKAFYERGWRGVHVEATPFYAALLRKDRPDEIVIQAAVNSTSIPMKFYEIADSGLSTGDPAIAEAHRGRGLELAQITVPCITLHDLFALNGSEDVHWLKIDVEGMERSVLASWGDSPVRPWVVVVESTLPQSQVESHKEWEAELLDRSYSLAYFDGLNRFYVASAHEELQQAFRTPPNVFDGFKLSGTARTPISHFIKEQFEARVAIATEQVEKITVQYDAMESTLKGRLSALQELLTAQEHEFQARVLELEHQTVESKHQFEMLTLRLAQNEQVFSAELRAREVELRTLEQSREIEISDLRRKHLMVEKHSVLEITTLNLELKTTNHRLRQELERREYLDAQISALQLKHEEATRVHGMAMQSVKANICLLAEDVDRLLISLQEQAEINNIELVYKYLTQISALSRECESLRNIKIRKSPDAALPFFSFRRPAGE